MSKTLHSNTDMDTLTRILGLVLIKKNYLSLDSVTKGVTLPLTFIIQKFTLGKNNLEATNLGL